MPADSSNIDAALIATLGSDHTLLSLCPNGAYIDEAPPGATRFVIVSLIDHLDEPTFEGRAFEDALYLVKAVMLSTAGGNIKAAAARIDELLEDQPLGIGSSPALAPSGYTQMAVYRESRIRTTEVDDIDPSIRWFHRGGQYRVQMAIVRAGSPL